MNVIITTNEPAWASLIKRELESANSSAVCTIAESGKQLIKSVRETVPNVIIVDAILDDYDGLELLESLKSFKQDWKIVFVSPLSNKEVIKQAIELGASYYCVTPIEPKIVAKRTLAFFSSNISVDSAPIVEEPKKKKHTSNDEKITGIFVSIGVPPHIRGYQYLREGIKIAVENPTIINCITKKLYPLIAERFETTASKVERAIRHAISVTWNRGSMDPSKKILGISIVNCRQKPTNGEFIALIADRILIEGINIE